MTEDKANSLVILIIKIDISLTDPTYNYKQAAWFRIANKYELWKRDLPMEVYERIFYLKLGQERSFVKTKPSLLHSAVSQAS